MASVLAFSGPLIYLAMLWLFLVFIISRFKIAVFRRILFPFSFFYIIGVCIFALLFGSEKIVAYYRSVEELLLLFNESNQPIYLIMFLTTHLLKPLLLLLLVVIIAVIYTHFKAKKRP